MISQLFRTIGSSGQLLILIFLFILGFGLRAINLNFNSPLSDEALYIVIGQLGFFTNDWTSYNATNLLAGAQSIYPSLSALAYSLGGILGSRVLSVISGTALILVTFFLTLEFSKNLQNKLTAGLISALLVAGSTSLIYISRLATMDILAFTVFFSSLLFLQKAINRKSIEGKGFFISGLLFFLSIILKLHLVVFLPLFLLFGFLANSSKQRSLFVSYFVLPITLMSLIYSGLNYEALRGFINLQSNWEKSDIFEILQDIQKYLLLISPFAVLGLIFSKFRLSFVNWTFLVLSTLWVGILHLISLRIFELERHLGLTIVFISILAGVGIGFLLELFRKIKIEFLGIILVLAGLIGYLFLSYQQLNKFNNLWINVNEGNNFLLSDVKRGDKVLTETGTPTILSLHQKIGNKNINTFDYLSYEGLNGEGAYGKAVRDGYFDYIQLESNYLFKSDYYTRMHDLVIENMDGNYNLLYTKGGVFVYKRAF